MKQIPILIRAFAPSRLRAFALACALPLVSWAQQVVSGTVTDDSGLPLPGATVVVQNTNRGTTTDFDGNYQIQATQGETLVFSYVGYASQNITIGSNATINVQMQTAGQLEEVVVTAHGIKRDKKALGYAVTSLKSEDVESRPQADIARVLNGKISGVNVVGTGGVAGSGTNITIRDNISITGNNQPLFVVNGIPFNSATNNESNITTGNGSVSASSRFLDLDPNSITDISVLKGLSATILYGNAGRNGVILITTKTGTTSSQESDKGFEVDFNQSSFFNEISNLPDYQNTYGQGGDNSINVGFVGNWGGRFDQNATVRHHYNVSRLADAFPEFQGVQVPYEAFENNVKDFFRTGFGSTTSVNISKASENVNYNINYGNTNEDGYIPGNNFRRDNFGIGGSSSLSNKITISGSFNFTNSRFTTPPIAANNGTGNFSILARTLFVPRNLDLNLPYQNPLDGSSVYYRTDQENPNWLVDNSQESINVNRFFNSINASFEVSEKINLLYRLGLDVYNEKQQFYINKGGVSALIAQQGYLRTTNSTNTNWDHSFIVTAESLKIADDISVNATMGFNAFSEKTEKFGIVSTGQLSFGLIDHNNFSTQTNSDPLGASLDFISEENTLGLYGQVQMDYSDFLFLTLSGRNDWSSTIEKENRSLFYPGTSISWIPTSQFEGLQSEILNFFKVRFSYATSAGFPGLYLTRPTLPQGTAVFTTIDGSVINTNTSSSIYPNPDLKAELHTEFEAGVEARLWKNKIGVEVSVYQRSSKDQILQKTLDTSTGFGTTFINAGEIETRGIEVDLNINPFDFSSPFQWNSNIAFSSAQNKVIDLPGGDEIFISGFSNLGNYAIEGEPLGVIRGSYALTDNEGNYLINPSTGNIIDSDAVGLDDKVIGDPNPDWRITNINSISFKGLTLSAQIEYVHGGDISSNTITSLLRRGVTKDTSDRESSFVIEGFYANPDTGSILLDENGNKIPNTIQLGANEVYFLNFVDPGSQQIYDGSVIRLREISLSYNFPKKFIDKTPLGSLSLSIIGNNLWFNAPNVPKHTNFDPEVVSTGVGNGRGLEFQTAPTSKKYGLNLRATF